MYGKCHRLRERSDLNFYTIIPVCYSCFPTDTWNNLISVLLFVWGSLLQIFLLQILREGMGETASNPGGALQAKLPFWFHYVQSITGGCYSLVPCWNRSQWPPLLKAAANYILLPARILHKTTNGLLAEGKGSLLLLFRLQQHLGDEAPRPGAAQKCCKEHPCW